MLYHRQVFWPVWIQEQLPKGLIKVRLGYHAQLKANERNIDVPNEVDMNAGMVFEVDVDSELKFCIRLDYNFRYDLILVIQHRWDGYFIKTVWLNRKSDCHYTLQREKYCHV